ncbi:MULTISPECIES: RsmD family RNA methyltransferase [Corynebacterium]|uniref:RsmD family RNA methyltransferase n=1 Tax=Corynebacterium TaxID=1716 RepID=UPI00124C2A19|nr:MULTISPECIES: RsmD family RNA methyltransferase [Corynebacterium]
MGSPRIISGWARGRKLAVPAKGTRPTSDRAKEGLFSSLQVRFGFENKMVLDLFAGSGALGLEAVSRGARGAVFVENHPPAAAVIRRNAELIPHADIHIEERAASSYLASAPRDYFDMVLADPPYDLADEAVAEMVRALIPTLRDGAAVVVERHIDSPETAWPACFTPTGQKLKKRTYGIARMDMAVFDASAVNASEDASADAADPAVTSTT